MEKLNQKELEIVNSATPVSHVEMKKIKSQNDLILEAKDVLNHICDGPITQFVLISRAMATRVQCKYSASVVANALYELLLEYNWLKSEDETDPFVVGS